MSAPEPDTTEQPLFPSRAVAAELIALLDERAKQRGNEDGGTPGWVNRAELADEILRRFVPLSAEPGAQYAIARIEAAIQTVATGGWNFPRAEADWVILDLLAGPHILGPSLSLEFDLVAPMKDGCLTWAQFLESESFAIELAQAKLAAAAFIRSPERLSTEARPQMRRSVDEPPVLKPRGTITPERTEDRHKPSVHLRVVPGFGIGIRLKDWDCDGYGEFASEEHVWGADEAAPSVWNGQLYGWGSRSSSPLPWLSRTIAPLLHLAGLGTRFTMGGHQVEAWSELADLDFAVSVLESQGYRVIVHDVSDAGDDDNNDADERAAWIEEHEEEVRRIQREC